MRLRTYGNAARCATKRGTVHQPSQHGVFGIAARCVFMQLRPHLHSACATAQKKPSPVGGEGNTK